MNQYQQAAEAVKHMRPKEAIFFLLGVIASLTHSNIMDELPMPDVAGEENGGDK